MKMEKGPFETLLQTQSIQLNPYIEIENKNKYIIVCYIYHNAHTILLLVLCACSRKKIKGDTVQLSCNLFHVWCVTNNNCTRHKC